MSLNIHLSTQICAVQHFCRFYEISACLKKLSAQSQYKHPKQKFLSRPLILSIQKLVVLNFWVGQTINTSHSKEVHGQKVLVKLFRLKSAREFDCRQGQYFEKNLSLKSVCKWQLTHRFMLLYKIAIFNNLPQFNILVSHILYFQLRQSK